LKYVLAALKEAKKDPPNSLEPRFQSRFRGVATLALDQTIERVVHFEDERNAKYGGLAATTKEEGFGNY
jgi:hypothetical protein